MDIKGIRLDPNANNDLKCENINNLKKCTITKEHFNTTQDGYYYTYHLNHQDNYIISYELSPIQVVLPEENEIIIRITNADNKNIINIGQKGFFSLITDFLDVQNIFDTSDIEEKTTFQTVFSDSNNNNYNVNCYLWKPKGEKLRLICKFDENIKDQSIKINGHSFEYKENVIVLFSEDYLKINQLNSSISVLYHDKQEIIIDDKNNEYALSFKKGIYNKEPLILFKGDMNLKNIYLDCKDETNEIKCTVKKDQLLQLLSSNGEIFHLSQLTDNYGMLTFNEIFPITIKYENVAKKVIYLTLTKLLTPKIDKNSFFIFETNVTDISILTSNYFNINTRANDVIKCLFKKNSEQKEDKLLLVCNGENKSSYILNIAEEIDVNEANILYNFKIAANEEIFTVTVSNEEGAKITSVYPESLDFSSNDKLVLKYNMDTPEKLNDIKLNNDSSSALECIDKTGVKECTVPKNHFKDDGYYYTYHKNGFGDLIISYEIPRIKIALNKEEENNNDSNNYSNAIIIASVIVGLILIFVIIFLIVRCVRRRKTNLDNFSKKIDKLFGDDANVELQPGGEVLE